MRFFERAAYDWLGASACGELMRSQGLLLGVEALDGLKYTDAALLGDACEARGAFTWTWLANPTPTPTLALTPTLTLT